ncbi:hypothetical protein [Chromobacterium phragmitis]|uniref:Uncharacterized protein n=1 Tax=Chromobacterium phragmitis TaxID=2202141 RepID=A0ABV0J0P8_9NEIS
MELDKIVVGANICARFPRINKNGTLRENDLSICEYGYHLNNCRVMKVIRAGPKEWFKITQNFLIDSDLWKNDAGEAIGGIGCDNPILACKNAIEVFRDPDLLQIVREEGYTQVTVVISGKRAIAVNTEGHSYARYVGDVITVY